ncbi:MAG: Lrp/AsnC family transcriptional regulator [Hyphomicrobiaceae bacterium]
MIDAIDRAIINLLQDGFPVVAEPYKEAGAQLGISAHALIERIGELLACGAASRFGPMFNADRFGGAFCLCAMAVPAERFDSIAETVNAFPEVAHNYERQHALNMWFVLATEAEDEIGEVLRRIEDATGLDVFDFPKLEEYFIGFRVAA